MSKQAGGAGVCGGKGARRRNGRWYCGCCQPGAVACRPCHRRRAATSRAAAPSFRSRKKKGGKKKKKKKTFHAKTRTPTQLSHPIRPVDSEPGSARHAGKEWHLRVRDRRRRKVTRVRKESVPLAPRPCYFGACQNGWVNICRIGTPQSTGRPPAVSPPGAILVFG